MVAAVRNDFLAKLEGFVEGHVRGRLNREATLALLRQEVLSAYGDTVPESKNLFDALDLALASLEEGGQVVLGGDRSQPSLTTVRPR